MIPATVKNNFQYLCQSCTWLEDTVLVEGKHAIEKHECAYNHRACPFAKVCHDYEARETPAPHSQAT